MSKRGKCITEGCEKVVQIRDRCKSCYEKFRRENGGWLSSDNGKIKNFTEIEAAYMAGIIDADGMITVTSRHPRNDINYVTRPSPLVMVTGGEMDLMNWFKEKVGAGTSYEAKTKPHRHDQNKANWNPVHRYQVTGLKAISLIDRILPYLIVKKNRGEMVRLMPMRGRDFAQRATPEQIELSERIVEQVRMMNRRGSAKHCLFGPLPLAKFD